MVPTRPGAASSFCHRIPLLAPLLDFAPIPYGLACSFRCFSYSFQSSPSFSSCYPHVQVVPFLAASQSIEPFSNRNVLDLSFQAEYNRLNGFLTATIFFYGPHYMESKSNKFVPKRSWWNCSTEALLVEHS